MNVLTYMLFDERERGERDIYIEREREEERREREREEKGGGFRERDRKIEREVDRETKRKNAFVNAESLPTSEFTDGAFFAQLHRTNAKFL